jgi:N-glycosylase/DNA lyase
VRYTYQDDFEISKNSVNGPLNLEKTIVSAQTSEPEWLRDGGVFSDVEELKEIHVKYSITQLGSVDDYVISGNFVANRFSDEIPPQLKAHLSRILGFTHDLSAFYRKFDSPNEPLSQTFDALRGLRLMRGTSAFESLICSILSQNNSALLWNRTVRLLMKHYGRKVRFSDGSTSYGFPQPARLAKVKIRQIQARTSMGYRARPVVEASRLVAEGHLELQKLASCSYEDAFNILLDLDGVGPKVADCFLLYGIGKLEAAPVDVWIHRIVTKLYFANKRVSRVETARFLRERFGEWAGYAQLYLFDFARRSPSLFTNRTAA